MSRAPRAAVVGGGICGLAAAEELAARGYAVEIFEAGSKLGGRIAPELLGEREIVLGGKNVGSRYSAFRELLARRGHDDYEFFGPDSGQVVRGKVRTLSFRSPSMRMRLGTRLTLRGQMLGGARFLRHAGQAKREEQSRYLGDPWHAAVAARTGDPTLPAYFGTALCQDVLRHTTVRMNGAEPDEVHVGTFGSNVALVIDKFEQLRGAGFGPWIRSIEADHVTRLGTRVDGLVVREGRVTGVRAGGEEFDDFDAVVVAATAPHAASVVDSLDRGLAALLRTVRYFPVGVVVAEYDRPAFPQRFAALTAPHGMALSNAGSYGLEDRHIVRWTFSGRPARGRVEPGVFDPESLLAEGEAFLAKYAPVGEARRVRFEARAFDPGLCAYRRHHDGFLRELDGRVRELPGLALAGDYLRGASLEACVRSGGEAAERVSRRRERGRSEVLSVAGAAV
jgi:oxygen-dependent protoporphyrinogen oxidase